MSKEITHNEKAVTAASYFYSFYNQIMSLNHNEAQYQNVLAELKNKHGSMELGKLEEEEKNVLMQQAQLVRYHARRTWIMYKTIKKSLEIKDKQDIEENYNSLKEDYVIKMDKLEKFIIHINSVLVNSIIKDLIDNSQELMEDIYSPENEKPKE